MSEPKKDAAVPRQETDIAAALALLTEKVGDISARLPDRELEEPDPEAEGKSQARRRKRNEMVLKAGKATVALAVVGIVGNAGYNFVRNELTVAGIIGTEQALRAIDGDLKLTHESLLSRSGHIMAEHAYGVEAGLNELGATLRPSLKSDLDAMREERNAAVAAALSPVYYTGYQQALEGEWSEEGLNQLVESVLYISYAENATLAPDGANGAQLVAPIATINAAILDEVTAAAAALKQNFVGVDIQTIDQVSEDMRKHMVVSTYIQMEQLTDKIGNLVGRLETLEPGDARPLVATFDGPELP